MKRVILNMRLDKFLCEMNIGTRSQVKILLKQGKVSHNGRVVTSGDLKINELKDTICFQGTPIQYQKYEYYMMNKPAGVVSATTDKREKTVLDLLKPEDKKKDIFPVGRLDKDTEGFLLLSNDGALAHRLLSPKKHVDKAYLVKLATEISEEDIQLLEKGVNIGEEKLTLPAKVIRQGSQSIILTIQEGKFHQVKRMMEAVHNRVIYLKRISFGALSLDERLCPGEYRALTQEEVTILNEAQNVR